MKLHDLHVLMAVAERKHEPGRYAPETGQPAISRVIATLEHALGVRLLDRNRRGVTPTEYGRALLNRCVTVFDELRQGVKNIEHLADATAGRAANNVGKRRMSGHSSAGPARKSCRGTSAKCALLSMDQLLVESNSKKYAAGTKSSIN
jgi:DNA-binding transcriptional LysR family regulator